MLTNPWPAPASSSPSGPSWAYVYDGASFLPIVILNGANPLGNPGSLKAILTGLKLLSKHRSFLLLNLPHTNNSLRHSKQCESCISRRSRIIMNSECVVPCGPVPCRENAIVADKINAAAALSGSTKSFVLLKTIPVGVPRSCRPEKEYLLLSTLILQSL